MKVVKIQQVKIWGKDVNITSSSDRRPYGHNQAENLVEVSRIGRRDRFCNNRSAVGRDRMARVALT